VRVGCIETATPGPAILPLLFFLPIFLEQPTRPPPPPPPFSRAVAAERFRRGVQVRPNARRKTHVAAPSGEHKIEVGALGVRVRPILVATYKGGQERRCLVPEKI